MPIIKNTYLIVDLETGCTDPHKTQPVELAAIAVNPRTLEIIPNSEFCSLIKPVDDDEAETLGLNKIGDEALKKNGKTREMLATAPDIKSVWGQFCNYVGNYNQSGKKWDNPILVGFNNNGFDDIILNRIACSDPWGFGPVSDRGGCGLFHPAVNVDIMKMLHPWFESNIDLFSLSMDKLRDYFGMSKVGAHEALQDVRDEAEIFIRLMKMTRKFAQKVTFKNSFNLNR